MAWFLELMCDGTFASHFAGFVNLHSTDRFDSGPLLCPLVCPSVVVGGGVGGDSPTDAQRYTDSPFF
jgi:hypothetical protein